MAAPEHVEKSLDLAAARVLEMRDKTFFIEDTATETIHLSTTPDIQLKKTGGTTGHREQGDNYISYLLRIPELGIRYSIYILPSTDDPAINQKALARAIRWFISHYGGGAVVIRDEPAT
ncbi:hypothetical protein LXA43DRAFT_1102685 [Ganoderma leucocontextum]|nr:hypothetical protein LXA43DRAFT_1102685 [Ganoderma leucocontextum]